jgi:hypothetical protein
MGNAKPKKPEGDAKNINATKEKARKIASLVLSIARNLAIFS